MVQGQGHHHRPTLKQSNKAFKSKHSSKGSLKDAAKGRTGPNSKTSTPSIATLSSPAHLRLNRRNAAKQAQAQKRSGLINAKRVFGGAPRIVAVVSLTDDVDAHKYVKKLVGEEYQVGQTVTRQKTSLQFLFPNTFFATLDACKIADYVLLILSKDEEVGEKGETMFRALQAQGLPRVVAVTTAVDKSTRASLLSYTKYFVPDISKVYDLGVQSESLNALRALCEGVPRQVKWRAGRAYLVAEGVQWVDDQLKITGITRGSFLDPNRLVHIPGYGDYQVNSIQDPDSGVVLAEPTADEADSLVSTNPDQAEGEQTWPSEEEMQGGGEGNEGGEPESIEIEIPDASNSTTPKSISKIPKGMSEYQASWMVDEDLEEGEGVDVDDGDADEEMDQGEKKVTFEDLPQEEEDRQLASWRQSSNQNRSSEERTHALFPDEIDTPLPPSLARTRFARYRGLRSFRTSPWDAYEALPKDYGRVFGFGEPSKGNPNGRGGTNAWKKHESRIEKDREEAFDAGVGIGEGTRVMVVLKGVTQAMGLTLTKAANSFPPVLFSLFPHEHKMTVLNFTVTRNTEYNGSVRSKDPLILCIGPRRLHVNPVYSTFEGGKPTPNNVHKFERYLQHGTTSMATVYAPVVVGSGKVPCVLLREDGNGALASVPTYNLVASGTYISPDPNRIIAKRIVLTGHPFKVHKKTATVRYMFFDSNDVTYFAPIQLHTKHGRTGHIKESLGTHGYFKAHFDGPISQMDTVCMSLYKRVYPRWSSGVEAEGIGCEAEVGRIESGTSAGVVEVNGEDKDGDVDMD